jgi:hypothetical protein
MRHQSSAIARGTRIPQTVARAGLHRLAQPGQQVPLPLLAQPGIRPIIQMRPLAGLAIPSTARGHERQRGMVLAIAAMGVEAHAIAALESAATDPAEAIVPALASTAPESAQQDGGVVREGEA